MIKIKYLFLLIFFFTFWLKAFSQNFDQLQKTLKIRGEAVISIKNFNINIQELSKNISIDKVTPTGDIIAYINSQTLEYLIKNNIKFTQLPAPSSGKENIKMATSKSQMKSWDAYPTWSIYYNMMYDFENNYPQYCKIFKSGTSINGKSLLFARITANPDQPKPRILLSSTMHGDEVTGYVTLLRFIDYLLAQSVNTKSNTLLNQFEIWINPLANPDGTYFTSDETVSGARRFNLNNVDLNRNFPDLIIGAEPDGNPLQQENANLIKLTDSLHFTASINFHGGSEVLNYPWDCTETLPADDNWWQFVCKQYADTAKFYGPSEYLTETCPEGYINGYQWYSINGSRQDYMNAFNRSREFTMEISSIKIPNPSLLPVYWEANYRSIEQFIKNVRLGFYGRAYNSTNGASIEAKIFIENFDDSLSCVNSDLANGNYNRPVLPGNYTVTCSATGFNSQTTSFIVNQNLPANINFGLLPRNEGISETKDENPIQCIYNQNTGLLTVNIFNRCNSNYEMNIINLHGIIENYDKQIINIDKWTKSYKITKPANGCFIAEVLINEKEIIRKKFVITPP